MRIQLKNSIPIPLKGSISADSNWNKELEFISPKTYLICAGSGKGKSSLLHMLHGSRRDYEGQIRIDGEVLSEFSPNKLAQMRAKKMAFVFQDLRLFPQLTAFENLNLLQNIHGLELGTKISEYAERLGVSDCLPKPCRILSLGQQQRIAILRALLQDFEFLVMDEPFSHLDEENQKKAGQLIDEVLKSKNAGLVMSALSENAPLHIDERMFL